MGGRHSFPAHTNPIGAIFSDLMKKVSDYEYLYMTEIVGYRRGYTCVWNITRIELPPSIMKVIVKCLRVWRNLSSALLLAILIEFPCTSRTLGSFLHNRRGQFTKSREMISAVKMKVFFVLAPFRGAWVGSWIEDPPPHHCGATLDAVILRGFSSRSLLQKHERLLYGAAIGILEFHMDGVRPHIQRDIIGRETTSR